MSSSNVIQRAKELRFRAERRLGELLRDMPKHEGGRPKKTGSTAELVMATVAALGIDKKTPMRAQRLAALPEAKFAVVAAGAIPIREMMKPATATT